MLRYLLRGEGVVIGRETVRTMMRRMCIEALYHRPNTLSRVQDTWFIRILLRGAPVERTNQACDAARRGYSATV